MDDLSPVRRGRHVTIRPLRPTDYTALHEIALFTDSGSRWRLHGGVPPQDQFIQILFRDCPATFGIEVNETGVLIGMVQLWNHHALNRNAHITAFIHPEFRGRGWPLESMILFVEYVFSVFSLRKLYFESLGPEIEQYRSIIGPILKQEAHYREHSWTFGEFVDCHVLALYAEDVEKLTSIGRGRVKA